MYLLYTVPHFKSCSLLKSASSNPVEGVCSCDVFEVLGGEKTLYLRNDLPSTPQVLY